MEGEPLLLVGQDNLPGDGDAVISLLPSQQDAMFVAIPADAITATSLTLPPSLPFEQWRVVCGQIARARKACLWWWGDALNYGEQKYGEMYATVLDASDYEYETLKGAKYVASRFELVRRRTNLSFGHHREAAPLPPEQADEFLDRAEREKLSVHDLRRAIKQARINDAFSAPIPPNGYRVIYADPPWEYADRLLDGYGPAEHHYPTMSLDALTGMRGQLRDPARVLDDAVLFLWVTSPLLKDCFVLIDEWGFVYKSSFVWDKVLHNMGHYNSVRHEFLLVCTRGSCTPDEPKLFDSVITEERTEHSVKPQIVYQIIETLYPQGKRIELFARKQRERWDRWGNEAT